MFTNLRVIAWTMPRKITEVLLTGRRQEQELQTRIDGGLSQLVYGGQSGKKGIPDGLKTLAVQYRKSN